MMPISLSPEADEVLDLLAGRRPPDVERFRRLVALRMELMGLCSLPLETACCSPLAANSQVEPGIFTGTTQVIGVQAVYGYGRHCWEQGHESVEHR
jgi:hypothetical protein